MAGEMWGGLNRAPGVFFRWGGAENPEQTPVLQGP